MSLSLPIREAPEQNRKPTQVQPGSPTASVGVFNSAEALELSRRPGPGSGASRSRPDGSKLASCSRAMGTGREHDATIHRGILQ